MAAVRASCEAAKLHSAQVATIVTLVFLAIAVGLTWYGPRSKSATLNYKVIGRVDKTKAHGAKTG
jgi:hypothetical protein